MDRSERRRAERAQRQQRERPASNLPGWTPPVNQLRSAKWVPATPEEHERQRQDFLAGTVFAEGAGHMTPTGGDGPPQIEAAFAVFVADDERTFGPSPQLREAFALLDKHGGIALHDTLTVGTAWSGLDGPEPLVKLKLEFHQPIIGSIGIVLMANNYAGSWRHIVGGGMLAVTTLERMRRATSAPDASFADGLEASLLFGIGSSPVLEHLISTHGW